MARLAAAAASALFLLLISVCTADDLPTGPFSKGVFEVKRFFNEEIKEGHYPNVTVNYIPGHVPELVLYNLEGVESGRLNVEGRNFEQMKALMKNLGFHSTSELAGGHRAGAHWELRDFLHIPNLFSHTGDPDIVSKKGKGEN